ncbi:hypothetical protein scyTo_0009725, partial [Scyliorhinus torazame]|nr:hypothetical protein [Scyliorhinus torazame]
LLLQLVKAQQASFVLERNLTVQEEIRQQLNNLELREEALNAISKTMGEDLLLDRFKNGAETERPGTFPNSSSLTCVAIESGSDFEERWFKKLRVSDISLVARGAENNVRVCDSNIKMFQKPLASSGGD